MRKVLLIILLLSSLAGSGCPSTPSGPRPLSLDEVEQRLGQPGVHLYDANLRNIHDKYHLPGARWVAYDRLSPAELPGDRAATLIFYCANEACGASHDSASRAIELGYQRVFVMPAGIYGWKRAGKRTESGPPRG